VRKLAGPYRPVRKRAGPYRPGRKLAGVKLPAKAGSVAPVWEQFDSFDFSSSHDRQHLKRVLDHDWCAGFIEAEGSFYILSTGVHAFGIGQTYNRHIIVALHKYFDIRSALKVTKLNNLQFDTKNKNALYRIAKTVQGRLLGMKSFEFALWLRTLRKGRRNKSLAARRIIHRCKAACKSRMLA
jgi:hypothetical protein